MNMNMNKFFRLFHQNLTELESNKLKSNIIFSLNLNRRKSKILLTIVILLDQQTRSLNQSIRCIKCRNHVPPFLIVHEI